MATIIQNAAYIPELDTYLLSSNVHDYRSVKLKDGQEFAIDGGHEYFKTVGEVIHLRAVGRVVLFRLTTDSSFTQEIAHKLLWGTRGKLGDQPLKFRPMGTFETDHLQAILDNCPGAGLIWKLTARYWINKRQTSSTCPTLSSTSTLTQIV